MRLPVLVFDIETMTDLKSGAHLYGLDLPEADLEQALTKLRRQESGMDFQRLALHEIVCISGLWIDELGAMKLFSFSREQYSEAEILKKFLSIFDKKHPTLVSWNGSQFDLPVILFRAMYHGLSASSFHDKLNLTAAVFRTEKTNTRATAEDGTTQNIGETRVDGFELGLNGNITNKWALSAGYTYLDSEIVDDGTAANEGNQVQNVAKNSATLWTTYQVLPQFTLGAGAVAMDKVYGNAANTKFVPGYVRYDAMARYNVNKNVDLQLNVNNLTDKRYFTKAYSSHYATEAEGRSAVLSLNFKY